MEKINREQEKVIKTLEDVLSFLKSVQIKNEESLVHMKKPLDDLQSSLKYLPISSPFSNLPTEITTDILSLCDLCDSGAFLAASVCQDWAKILRKRLENTEVIIGKHCSNKNKCEDYKCFMPAEVMKVSAAHKLDILSLQICHPIPEVNFQLFTDVLSVSHLTIENNCKCSNDKMKPVLSNHQLEHLFDGIEKSEQVMNRLELKKIDLTHLDQDKLINFLLTKTEQLELDCKFNPPLSIDDAMLNGEMLVGKLLQDSPEIKLSDLTLTNFMFSDELGEDLADALCKVENVSFCGVSPLSLVTTKKLILNTLTRPIKTKQLILDCFYINFCDLSSPEDLRNWIEKFEILHLHGRFTSEQLDAARLVAEVEQTGMGINGTLYYTITKDTITSL